MDIKSVNLQEPIPEIQPKRPRGRPPKVDPITGERVNKPSGRATPSRKRSLETQIGAMLTSVNIVLMMVPPTRDDALDTAEITALAKALDSQAQQSPLFRKYLERALAVGSGGQLVGVVAIIAARRAARHGLAPAELDPMLGAMLGAETSNIGAMRVPTDAPATDPDTGEARPFDYENTL